MDITKKPKSPQICLLDERRIHRRKIIKDVYKHTLSYFDSDKMCIVAQTIIPLEFKGHFAQVMRLGDHVILIYECSEENVNKKSMYKIFVLSPTTHHIEGYPNVRALVTTTLKIKAE